MRILLTNTRLEHRAGTELYVLDVARWLRDQGHSPVAYSARLGPLADDFRAESIPVVSDLARVGDPPDLIHGQHHLATMAALGAFPLVPAVNYCHGWTPWEESPVHHPAVRRYIAVSNLGRERLVAENGISPNVVRIIPNFVDLDRFPRRGPLPERPERALVFSNHAHPDNWFDAVRSACETRGIAIEAAGLASGNPITDPGLVLGEYDLVFAKGRSALEAIATGGAVILCDLDGCGPLARPDTLDALRGANFGHLLMRHSHYEAYLGEEIDRYDPDEAGSVTDVVRSELGRDHVLPSLWEVYEEALEDAAARPHSIEQARAAEQAYLGWLDRNYPPSLLDSVQALQRDAYELQDGRARAQAETERAVAEAAGARHEAARARHEAARSRAEAARTAATLERLESNVLVRSLLPRLSRARERLAPVGSRRYRAYATLASQSRSDTTGRDDGDGT